MPDSDICLDHTSSDFTPLDHSQLNDMRRRVVKNENPSDEELKHSIQTLLFFEREKTLSSATKAKKASKAKEKPLDPAIDFDDLLNSPL